MDVEDRSDWPIYEVTSLPNLMSRGIHGSGGKPLVTRTPCLPDARVAIPPVGFGQVEAPDFPVEQSPGDARWDTPEFAIYDGYAFTVRDAVVQGELGIVTVGNFVVHETLNFALPGHIGRFEWVGKERLRLPPPGSESRVGAAAHLLCGFVGNRNYAHWLTDIVPNILIPPYHDTFSGTTLLFPKLRNAWQQQTLDLIPEARPYSRFVDDQEYIWCESLQITPRIKLSDFFPHPHRLLLFDEMKVRAGAATRPHRRIYISRRDSGARRIVNEEELVDLVEANGFETVCLSELSVGQQLALFAEATHIIAPHGAGLANLVACSSGTVLCELHMDSYVQWAFRRLSGLPPIKYGCLVGRTESRGEWVHNNTWRAPIEQLQTVLSSAPFAKEGDFVALPPAVTKSDGRHSNRVRRRLITDLWRGNDPFHGFPGSLFESDTQGWNSVHPYLLQTIEEKRPAIVVEIGVWKGGSVLTMASELQRLGLDAVVIAIDTWLGSWEHWHKEDLFQLLDVMNGHPSLYQKFMSNVVRAGLQNYVVPLPLDSMNAAHLCKLLDIRPDVVHLDGCHDYRAVFSDLALWWPQINDNGLMIGDDYYDNDIWPEVRRAFDVFFGSHPNGGIEHTGGKCRVRKLAK